MLHAERHRAWARGHPEFTKQTAQIRVGDLVVGHEAGIDGYRAMLGIDAERMAVAADVVALFVQGELVAVLQEVRAAQAGDAGTDDCNPFHASVAN